MKKVSPLAFTHSSCKASLDWLREYAKNWLSKNVEDCGHVWLPDDNHFALTTDFPKSDHKVEIVFTGSFLLRLIELPYWRFDQVRIWTFSSVMKQILAEYLDIDPNKVGLIPHLENSPHQLNLSKAELLYVGRLNWTKNIEALLYLTSYLQQHYSKDITLNLVGTSDDLPDESLGRVEAQAFSDELPKIINSLSWVTPPLLSGYHQDWDKFINEKSHFISLSTSMYEDFGVSANVAGKSVPCLLSSWGGHWDQKGSYLLSSELIFHSFEPMWIKKRKTQLLAQELIQGHFKSSPQTHITIPGTISFKEVVKGASAFIERYLPDILLLLREDLDTFADTEKGKSLFYSYRHKFAGSPAFKTLHIYGEQAKDHDFSTDTLLLREEDLLFSVYQKLLFRDIEVEVNAVDDKLVDFLITKLNRSDLRKI